MERRKRLFCCLGVLCIRSTGAFVPSASLKLQERVLHSRSGCVTGRYIHTCKRYTPVCVLGEAITEGRSLENEYSTEIKNRPLRPLKEPELILESDTLKDEPYMVRIVALTFTVMFVMTLSVGMNIVGSATPVEALASCLAAAAAGILFSDAFTGVFHWSVDNYGDFSTPIFGPVIEAFQGHHGKPFTITLRPIANNIHKICYGVLPLLGLLALSHSSLPATTFGIFALFGLLMCQELHKYSHMLRPPEWIAALQSRGVILSRKEHGLHHSSPFEEKYCIVTGHCNDVMDKLGVYRKLEKLVYERTGLEPNCWKLDETGVIKARALEA